MGGSWRIKHLRDAERDLKRILKPFKAKSQKEKYVSFYWTLLESLREFGLHPSAEPEPVPGGASLPQDVELWKIRVSVPWLTGAIAKLRIIYLRLVAEELVIVISVYTHRDYEKRPPDRLMAELINGSLRKS